jgi:hypothetical protein
MDAAARYSFVEERNMTLLKIAPADLAGTRFALSPAAETMAALQAFAEVRPPPWLTGWLAGHWPALARLTAAEPTLATLLDLLRTTHWIPDFLVPPPADGDASFTDELARIRATPPDQARHELGLTAGGSPPAAFDGDDLVDRLAAGFATAWEQLIAPDWPRHRAVLERRRLPLPALPWPDRPRGRRRRRTVPGMPVLRTPTVEDQHRAPLGDPSRPACPRPHPRIPDRTRSGRHHPAAPRRARLVRAHRPRRRAARAVR